jgi:hypothetical protein
MSIPNHASTVKKPGLSYWERPGKRQTRNSQAQKRLDSKCRIPRLPGRPMEIWLLQMMPPKDVQSVMQVSQLWYSEANRILFNKISTRKGLYAYLKVAFYNECF